jgi:hypothetical protein
MANEMKLEEADDFIRIVFPKPSKLACWLAIGIIAAFALAPIVFPVFIGLLEWHLFIRGDHPSTATIAIFHHEVRNLVLVFGPLACGSLLIIANEWRLYRRDGFVPPVLSVARDGVTLSYPGIWGRRSRRLSRQQIIRVQLKQLKPIWGSLNPWRTTAYLHFRPESGRRLRCRLSSNDAEFPNRIAERICSMLGTKLETH